MSPSRSSDTVEGVVGSLLGVISRIDACHGCWENSTPRAEMELDAAVFEQAADIASIPEGARWWREYLG